MAKSHTGTHAGGSYPGVVGGAGRTRGQGLNTRGGARGDQYVKLNIVIPSKLTDTEKELFEKLAAESRFNARESMAGAQ